MSDGKDDAMCSAIVKVARRHFLLPVLMVSAGALRLWLLLQGWPGTDSDEGTMGLMARHIAYNGAHPLIFYGQDYLAPFEAYLAALFFHLWGSSVLTLRLSVLVLYLLFLLSLYLLILLLYGRGLALFSLLLLTMGSADVLFRQLEATGGAPDVTLCSALLPLASLALALRLRAPQPASRRAQFLRRLACGLWGLLAGAAIWADPLILPFVGLSLLFLLFCCWPQLRGLSLALLLTGLLLGLAPQLLYKLTVPSSPEQLALLGTGYREASYPPPPGAPVSSPATSPAQITPSPLTQIGGSLLISLPLVTGGNAFCTLSADVAWPLSAQSDGHVVLCTALHGFWSAGYLLLWGYATLQALRACLACWRRRISAQESQALPYEAGRLLILGSAGATLFLYTLFPQATLTPWPSSRYLVGLLVSIPAVLAPLWQVARKRGLAGLCSSREGLKRVICRLALLTPLVVWCVGTVTLVGQAPAVAAVNQQQQALIDELLAHRATRIYSDYWDCDRIIFQSNERIICAVLDDGLQRGLNRYAPYWQLVQRQREPAYLFPVDSPQDLRLLARLRSGTLPYQRQIFRGYAIYLGQASVGRELSMRVPPPRRLSSPLAEPPFFPGSSPFSHFQQLNQERRRLLPVLTLLHAAWLRPSRLPVTIH